MSKGAALLTVALVCASLAPAQQPDSALTLDDCIRRALAVPSSVSIARLDRSIADKDLAIARAGLLPQASANVGTVYTSVSKADRDTFAFIPSNAVHEYIGLGHIFQEIDISGRIRAELARARANQQAAQAGSGIAERDLKRAVSNAYYRLLLSRRLVDALQSSLAESQAFERRVKLLAAGGEAARADVVKASAQVAILQQTLTSAHLAATLSNQDLAAYWTADVDPLLNIADTFDQIAADQVSVPYMRRLEFTLLDAQRSGFQSDAKRIKAFLYPQLMLNFNYGLDSSRVAWNNRGYSAVVGINMQIFDWFRTLNTARQFTARAQQVSENKAIAERRYSQEYRAALARTTQYREQITQAKELMSLAEEDFKLSRIRYEGGEGAAVDVVVAQAQLVQAKSGYYTSIANYLSAKLDLEVAAGK